MRLSIPKPNLNRAARRLMRRLERRTRRTEATAERRTPEAPSPVLNALVAGAVALPGLARDAAAASPVEQTTTSFSYYRYQEDDLRPSRAVGGNNTRERMEVDAWLFQLVTPIGDRTDLSVDTSFEKMSGASPWYVFQADPAERRIQVMSQATIEDRRGDLMVTGNRYFDWGKLSLSGGGSIEKDFYSADAAFGGEWDFNDKNTTLSAQTNVSLNWIEPTSDRNDPTRIDSDDRQSVGFTASLSQVLTRHSIFQTTINYEYATGYLSDPYKLVQVGFGSASNLLRDRRPDLRNQFAWLNRYRHHISGFNGTVHLDYQLYHDDWSVTSHTFDVAYHQTLPWGIEIIPSFRYYSQSQASFYQPVFSQPKANGNYSSDYRLSPYGAISYQIKGQWSFIDPWWKLNWVASASYERYESRDGWALETVNRANPGLVKFRVFSGTISARF
jgi:hypothetical protein